MENNLVQLPVKYRKRKAKAATIKQNIVEFPATSVFPEKLIGSSNRYAKGDIVGEKAADLGINDGDEVLVDTLEAVGNGNLLVIDDGKTKHLGIARFIGGGKVRLDYIHSTEVFELAKVKIIGRVTHSIKKWK